MIESFLILNKQGMLRLVKIFSDEEVKIDTDDLARRAFDYISQAKDTNVIFEFHYDNKPRKLLYRFFNSIYIVLIIDELENELGILDFINLIFNTLDIIFKGVTELDIMNNPEKVYYLLDEMISGGVVVETDKAEILSNYNEKMKDS
jgi:AP-3 complex subunit sigma